MRKVFYVEIDQLQPGMTLAEPLDNNNSGIALYTAGTVINERILKRICTLPLEGRVLVYDPDSLFEAASQETPPEFNKTAATTPNTVSGEIKEQEKIELSPEKISRHSLKIYSSTFKTVKQFYKSAALNGQIDEQEAKTAANEIAGEIARDPQVLLQIAVLKAIDNYTFGHAIHVAIYATMLARVLGFSEDEMKQICLAGLLHDIGKVDTPVEILNKPDRLNPDEYNIIKNHVLYSFKRVRGFKDVNRNILAAIAQHHEKIDGSGYMQKLKGKEIHKWGRIMAIADVYDAVTSKRAYKEAYLPHEGAEILMGSVGHLDYDLLKLFLKYISIYPVGCDVILSTGETGTVVASNPDLPTRPFVQIKTNNTLHANANVLDLSRNLTTFITGIIKGV